MHMGVSNMRLRLGNTFQNQQREFDNLVVKLLL